MKIASVASVKAKFSGYIKASKSGPVIVISNKMQVSLRYAFIITFFPLYEQEKHVKSLPLYAGYGHQIPKEDLRSFVGSH